MSGESLLQFLRAALIVDAALFVGLIAWMLPQAYWPITRRRRRTFLLTAGTLYRYAARDTIVEHGDGTITLEPYRGRWHEAGLAFRRALYFYAGHRRRGGWLNRQSKKKRGRAPHDVVLIDAADFLAVYGQKRMRCRPWDHAIAVPDPYTGPARIIRDVDHTAARRSTTPPA